MTRKMEKRINQNSNHQSPNKVISKTTYIVLYLLLGVALSYGLMLPLMENDSAQHATMAMQMAQSNHYWEILKGGNDYLDKPHMHFWLSAFSFELFGFETWAYRLPALLLTLCAGFATYKLADLLYQNKSIARLSALMFLSAQAIVISLHDVRTDAVLTSFSILAIWQWTYFLKKKALLGAVLGGLFTAFAYSTKGIIAIAVIGAFLFFMVLYKNYWQRLLSWKLALGLVAFILGSTPMLYAYYLQFGMEGIEFITYGQATGRFSGEDFGGASKNDYFFYFHTLLWAFLPWSLWFYMSLYFKIKNWNNPKWIEISSLGATMLFIIAMNFSQFKLPHYLNIVFPLMAIFTASTIVEIFQNYRSRIPKVFQITQYSVAALGLILLSFLGLIAFPLENIPVIGILLFSLLLLIVLFITSNTRLERTVVVSAGFILFSNIYLNTTFYPQLIEYQAGEKLGKVAARNEIKAKDLYMIDGQYSWSMDWHIQGTTQKTSLMALRNKTEAFWVMVYDKHPNDIKASNWSIGKSYRVDNYRITRLNKDFINPLSRPEVLSDAWLVQFIPE